MDFALEASSCGARTVWRERGSTRRRPAPASAGKAGPEGLGGCGGHLPHDGRGAQDRPDAARHRACSLASSRDVDHRRACSRHVPEPRGSRCAVVLLGQARQGPRGARAFGVAVRPGPPADRIAGAMPRRAARAMTARQRPGRAAGAPARQPVMTELQSVYASARSSSRQHYGPSRSAQDEQSHDEGRDEDQRWRLGRTGRGGHKGAGRCDVLGDGARQHGHARRDGIRKRRVQPLMGHGRRHAGKDKARQHEHDGDNRSAPRHGRHVIGPGRDGQEHPTAQWGGIRLIGPYWPPPARSVHPDDMRMQIRPRAGIASEMPGDAAEEGAGVARRVVDVVHARGGARRPGVT